MGPDQRLDNGRRKVVAPADGMGVFRAGCAQDAHQRGVGNGFRAHEEDCGNADRPGRDEIGGVVGKLRATGEGGDGLAARFLGGGVIERREELAELVKIRSGRKTQALEAGNRGHQHDILRPPRLRSLQFAKPVRHETPCHPRNGSPSPLHYRS
jgi:hypothetical protein